jgi:hypothetical protein
MQFDLHSFLAVIGFGLWLGVTFWLPCWAWKRIRCAFSDSNCEVE